MKFIEFNVTNYKGIKNIKLTLHPEGSNVFTLIGLNESGKASILEAISKFNPAMNDDEIKELYSSIAIHTTEDNSNLIPKQLKANFNEQIVISATLTLNQEDKDYIIKYANKYTDENGKNHKIQDVCDKITIKCRRSNLI